MTFLLAWQNLIFILPLLVGVIFLIGSASGLLHGDADVDHDLHLAETDHDVEGDAGHVSHVVPHDMHGDHAHAGGGGDDRTMVHRALEAFGIGRVPLSIVLTTAMLLFGGVGMATNFLLAPVVRYGWIYGWASLTFAVVAMVFGTGAIARFVARVMPTSETVRMQKRDLIGREADVLFTIQAGERGFAQTHDQYGNLHQVEVRSSGVAIAKGIRVTLVDFDPRTEVFGVVPVTADVASA